MKMHEVEYCILHARQILQICIVNKSILSENQYHELISCNEVISSKGNNNDKKIHLQNLEDAKSEFLKDNLTNSKYFDNLIGHFKSRCTSKDVAVNTSPTKAMRSI